MKNLEFGDWLTNELHKRDMTQSDLARAAGLSRQGISGAVTGFRKPGTQLCLSISKALNIPPQDVFTAAGIIPTKKRSSDLDQLIYMISTLSDSEQSEVKDFVGYKISQRKRKNIEESAE